MNEPVGVELANQRVRERQREERKRRGDVAAAAATVPPVSWLLLACQAGGNTEQEKQRWGTENEAGQCYCGFFFSSSIVTFEAQGSCRHTVEVVLDTGQRSAALWITSSE